MTIYRDWSDKAAINARQLTVEARLLFDAGHLARAYYLSHMAIEEFAKYILLLAMDVGETSVTELPKVRSLLRNHKKKIEFIVRCAASGSSELNARVGGLLQELVDHINNLKNNTMYVSFAKGEVLTPDAKISGVDVGTHLALAESLANASAE